MFFDDFNIGQEVEIIIVGATKAICGIVSHVDKDSITIFTNYFDDIKISRSIILDIKIKKLKHIIKI